MEDTKDWTALCVITGAHGVRGAVKVKPFTELPESILAYGALSSVAGEAYDFSIIGSAKGQLICTIEGITDRNDAEKLRGLELGVAKSQLPEAEEGSYYITDLIGLDVQDTARNVIGTVKSVQNFGAGDMLEIAFNGKKTEFFAFTDANFPEVDLQANSLTLCEPERIIVKEETS